MPRILTETQILHSTDANMEESVGETHKGGASDTSKITDFFKQKPQLPPPKPAKGLLAFFSPPKGKLKEGTTASGKTGLPSDSGNDENSFTKIRHPSDATETLEADGVNDPVEKSKGKKRKVVGIHSDSKRRRKNKEHENSLEDFEDSSSTVKVACKVKQKKTVKRKGTKDKTIKKGTKECSLKGLDEHEEKKDDLHGVDVTKEAGTRSDVEVVVLPARDDVGQVDDSVLAVSFVDFMKEVNEDGKDVGACTENTCEVNSEMDVDGGKIKETVCSADVGTLGGNRIEDCSQSSTHRGKIFENNNVPVLNPKSDEITESGADICENEISWADFQVENSVVENDVKDVKIVEKGSKKTNCVDSEVVHTEIMVGERDTVKPSVKDSIGDKAAEAVNKRGRKTSVLAVGDVVDGDKTDLKSKKRIAQPMKKGTMIKGCAGDSVALSATKGKKSREDKNATKEEATAESIKLKKNSNGGIAKFFVKNNTAEACGSTAAACSDDLVESTGQCIVKVDVHSPQMSPPTAGKDVGSQRKVSSSNVVVFSSDSDSISELETHPLTPAKDIDVTGKESTSEKIKYPAIFFGKRDNKEKDGPSSSVEELMEMGTDEEQTTDDDAPETAGKSATKLSVTKGKVVEEIVIGNSTEEEQPSFSSPRDAVVKKKATQMTFNFSGGGFRMEKEEKTLDASSATSTSDNESNTEAVEEVPGVTARKSLSSFFTSTPKAVEKKKVKKGGKLIRGKGQSCKESKGKENETKEVEWMEPAMKKGSEKKDKNTDERKWTGPAKKKGSAKKGKAAPVKESKSKGNNNERNGATLKKIRGRKELGSPEVETPVSGRERPRRALRSVYRATLVNDIKSPLRMKLTRTGAKSTSSTSGGDDSSPRKTRQSARKVKECKVTAAQYLLQKARENKAQKAGDSKLKGKIPKSKASAKSQKDGKSSKRNVKAKKKTVANKGAVNKRRISKDSDVSVVIVGADDENEVNKKKGSKKGVTPKKSGSQKTPRKSTPAKKGKVAPLFMSKEEKAAAAEEEKEVEVIETPTIIKYWPVRDSMINSDISDDIPHRLKQSVPSVVLDWPPFPGLGDNHILQKPLNLAGLDVWNLSSCNLNLRHLTVSPGPSSAFTFTFEKSLQPSLKMPKVHECPEVFSPELIQGLLGEVRENSPGFPVRKMYKSLVARRQISELEMVENPEGDDVSVLCGESSVEVKQTQDDSVVVIDTKEAKAKGAKEGGEKVEKKNNKRRSGRLRRSKGTDTVETKAVQEKKEPAKKPEEQIPDPIDKKEDKSRKTQVWTDLYQPRCSSDIIGNSNCVKRLKTWLTEWKERVDREARKQKILERKEARKNKNKKGPDAGSKWLTDDESDFELSDMSDDDYEDDGITNTILLTGPHGIGKTSSVYALAQELGYKVFEVNASSRRTGKQVMTQLLEATQSHHVSKENLGAGTPSTPNKPNPFAVKSAPTPSADTKKSKENPPTSFFNMFNKNPSSDAAQKKGGAKNPTSDAAQKKGGAKNSKKKAAESCSTPEDPKKRRGKKSETAPQVVMTPERKKAGRKRKADVDIESKSSSSKPSVKKTPKSKVKPKEEEVEAEVKRPTASISLILFEEVDIIFEEDKGFIQAIQSLMSMTKRPMIMTTSDPKVANQFEGFFEELVYKKPSVSVIASYLQVLCLAENVRTDHKDVLSVVRSCGGDVRRSLLLVQFWMVSGAGKEKVEKTLKLSTKSDLGLAKTDPQQAEEKAAMEDRLKLLENKIDNSEDEFEAVPARRRVRRNVPQIDSDSSMDSVTCTPQKPKRLKLAGKMDAIQEDSQETLQIVQESLEGNSGYTEVPGPMVHVGLFGSMIGPAAILTEDRLLGVCSMDNSEIGAAIWNRVDLIVEYDQRHDTDFIANNYLQFLPLPRQVTTSPYPQIASMPVATVKKFSRIRADWYDSEDSRDGFESLVKKGDSEESEKVSVPSKDSLEGGDNIEEKMDTSLDNSGKISATILHASVRTLSRFYDDLSFFDTLERKKEIYSGHCGDKFKWNRGNVLPGLDDEVVRSNSETSESDWFSSTKTYAKLSSLNCCCDRLKKVMEKVENCEGRACLLEKMTLPVEANDGQVKQCCDFDGSMRHSSQKKCARTVANNLPVCVQGQISEISTDYLPAIRTICKSEETKEAAKIKRRFFHYMDSISFHLKPTILETLNNTFR